MTPHQGAGAGQAIEVGFVHDCLGAKFTYMLAGRIYPSRIVRTSANHLVNATESAHSIRTRPPSDGESRPHRVQAIRKHV